MTVERRVVVCRGCLLLGEQFDEDKVHWMTVRFQTWGSVPFAEMPTSLCPDCQEIKPYPIEEPKQ